MLFLVVNFSNLNSIDGIKLPYGTFTVSPHLESIYKDAES